MIIKDLRNKGYPSYDKLLNVYGIYWFDGITYFYCSPKGHEGLLSYLKSECEIVDNNINEFVLISSSNGSDMFIHKVLSENNLLDRLLDDGIGNYIEFVNRLGHEP